MSETPYTIGRIGLVIRGAYSDAASYNALDVVQYDDSSYVCSAACTGIPPVDHQYWMLLAEGATHITTLNADVIKSGTLSVDRLLVTGADSIVYEINASSAGLNASQLTEEKYKKYIDGSTIVAQSVTSDKIKSHTIVADNVDIGDLFAATATIDALKTMTVKSIEDGSALILNKDQIRMETPSTVIAIPGGEEGQVVFRADANGVYADKIESRTLARRVPGGVYTVGNGRDYDTLSDAFADINDAVLDGDVVLKLVYSDAGGVLRGVGGGHRVIVMGINLVNYWATADFLAQTTAGIIGTEYDSINVTSTVNGNYQYALYDLGRVTDLGIRGMPVTMRTEMSAANGTPDPVVWLLLMNPDHSVEYQGLVGLDAARSGIALTTNIPEDTALDAHLVLRLYVTTGTTRPAGTSVNFTRLSIEVGPTYNGALTYSPTVSNLRIENNQAQVHLTRLTSPGYMKITNSAAFLTRNTINGNGGVGLLAEMAKIRMTDNDGTCQYAVNAEESLVFVTGKAPSGIYSGWQVDTTTAQIVNTTTTAPTATIKTLTANSTGTYSSYWWTGDRSIRQGYTPSNNRIRGGMWFDMSQIPSGATVSGMRLTLARISGYGKGADVDVKAYGTASNARNGAPALTAGSYELGTIGEGKTKTFDLPDALVTGLKSGAYKGIVLFADDTSVLSGKTYSSNYARFGGTDGTAPKLAVTYTA